MQRIVTRTMVVAWITLVQVHSAIAEEREYWPFPNDTQAAIRSGLVQRSTIGESYRSGRCRPLLFLDPAGFGSSWEVRACSRRANQAGWVAFALSNEQFSHYQLGVVHRTSHEVRFGPRLPITETSSWRMIDSLSWVRRGPIELLVVTFGRTDAADDYHGGFEHQQLDERSFRRAAASKDQRGPMNSLRYFADFHAELSRVISRISFQSGEYLFNARYFKQAWPGSAFAPKVLELTLRKVSAGTDRTITINVPGRIRVHHHEVR